MCLRFIELRVLSGYNRKRERERFCMMGTRAEHNKEDFVGGGFGFGVVEPSHREVMIPSHHHHYPSYISPSSYSGSAGVTDPVFSSSTNHAYTCSLGEMYSLAGSNSAAVSAADPLFTLSSSGFKVLSFMTFELCDNIKKYLL